MAVLPRNMILQRILRMLPFSLLSRPSVVESIELVEAILYKLKSCCQWHLLPAKQFFTDASLTWQGGVVRFNT